MPLSTPDEEATVTVFRRWRDDGSIIAVFPEIGEGSGRCSCYQHVGQHGSTYFTDVIESSDPPAEDDEDVHRLIAELTSIGYNLLRVSTYPIPPLSSLIRLPHKVASCYNW